jgi:hypothetical protein
VTNADDCPLLAGLLALGPLGVRPILAEFSRLRLAEVGYGSYKGAAEAMVRESETRCFPLRLDRSAACLLRDSD